MYNLTDKELHLLNHALDAVQLGYLPEMASLRRKINWSHKINYEPKEKELPYNIDIKLLLEEILVYMDTRQDADHNGERFVPNEEMIFSSEIRQALYQLSH